MTVRMEKAASLRLRRLSEHFEHCHSLLIVLQYFPDPDAIASAMALKLLAHRAGVAGISVACGSAPGRVENLALLRYLKLNLLRLDHLNAKPFERIAMVDAQPGAGNAGLPPDRIADIVIDHHPIRHETRQVPYHDIRSRYGATSTMLWEYLEAAGIRPPMRVATALAYGIRSDTSDFGRDSSDADIQALSRLYPLANLRQLGRIVHAPLSHSYFHVMVKGLCQARQYGRCTITSLGIIQHPDSLGEVADLLLREQGIRWTMCHGIWHNQLLISIRTDDEQAHAGRLLRRAVNRLGHAGGHAAMAGAQIPLKSAGDAGLLTTSIERRFLVLVNVENPQARHLVTPSFIRSLLRKEP